MGTIRPRSDATESKLNSFEAAGRKGALATRNETSNPESDTSDSSFLTHSNRAPHPTPLRIHFFHPPCSQTYICPCGIKIKPIDGQKGAQLRRNDTTTNAEPDNFPFCVFVPFHKAPRRYQSFCVEATKEILRFLFASFAFPSISIQPSLDPISFDRACLAGQLYFFGFFKMRNTNKISQFLTSLPGFANCSRLEGHIWRKL